MKKIMFVCLALSNGGAERVVSILSDTLVKKGYTVYVLVLTDREQVYEVHPQIQILKPDKYAHGIKEKMLRIWTVRKAIKTHQIDTVIAFSHYNTMYSVVAGTGLHARIIGSERNDPAQIEDRRVLHWMRRQLYRKLDCLVCQTEVAKNYFPADIRKKSVVIMNPLNPEKLPQPYTGVREKRIVCFARLEKQKNIPMALDAFAKLLKEYPDYSFEIYGDGQERDSIVEYVHSLRLDDCVSVYPFVDNIHEKVLKASMFVLSSDYEGLSNSMLEAMAIGLPSVVTDCPCGGAAMVIRDGVNGMLVPVGDANAMYMKMRELINHPQTAASISREAVAIRETLNARKITEEWIQVIGE